MQIAASEVLLDVDTNARRAIAIDPALVLAGHAPRLIDEWQIEPSIWNHIRRAVDERGKPGQFILTGSAAPADDITRHTGAGRLARLRMRPMTLAETGHSIASVSLKGLLDGATPKSPDTGQTIGAMAERVVAGGWPAHAELAINQAAIAVRDYLSALERLMIVEDQPAWAPHLR